MASAGEEIHGSKGSKKNVSGAGLGTESPRSGETRTSPAQELMEALRKSQEEIPRMGMAEVIAYQESLRALRVQLLQRIKEEEEKAAAAAAEQATAAEPCRAG
jgi:TolA-binding protein